MRERPLKRSAAITLVLVAALSVSVRAQEPARVTFDSTISLDTFRGDNTVHRPNIIVDVAAVARIGDNWLFYARPWFRQPRAPEWEKEIYQAALQYQRPGRIATRVDIGYIASPLGLGMMDTRPGVNPMIMPHIAYFSPMPAFDKGAPRVMPLSATYPLGAEVTMSGRKWDARGALVGSAPTRVYEIGAEKNPAVSPFVIAGGGISPMTGLRFGVSMAAGEYVRGSELTPVSTHGRRMTLVGVEGEYAFGYTRLSGEVIRDSLQTAFNDVNAYEWFIQGAQTLTPRWFVAGRTEGTSAPGLQTATSAGTRTVMRINEATVGFRLTPEITLRSSFVSRKAYTRTDSDQQFGMSVVWNHRWW